MTRPEKPQDRALDMTSLKALAHPLRVRIVDTLSIHGQSTASGLASRLGESSGATSYHLRQLEKHGFVREVEGKGTGRERWWERVPGGILLRPDDFVESPSELDAYRLLSRQFVDNAAARLSDFVGQPELVGREWMDVVELTTANLRLTPEQLAQLVGAFEQHVVPIIDGFRGQTTPGALPVQVQFNAFPIVDGPENAQ